MALTRALRPVWTRTSSRPRRRHPLAHVGTTAPETGPLLPSALNLRVHPRMARRPRGLMTTLAEMRRKQPACATCGLDLASGEPVAWTVGRDRIHESCIGLARVAAP